MSNTILTIVNFDILADNGLNPFWNEKFTIKVLNPDVALIRFGVSDEDPFGDSHFLGQATYPVTY